MQLTQRRTTESPRRTVLAIMTVAIGVLALAEALGDWAFLASLALVLGALGWAGVRWGASSVDGRDWRGR